MTFSSHFSLLQMPTSIRKCAPSVDFLSEPSGFPPETGSRQPRFFSAPSVAHKQPSLLLTEISDDKQILLLLKKI